MNAFENDLSLYNEANEGLKDMANKVAEKVNNLPVVQTLKKLAKAFGDWIMAKIKWLIELGNKLKANKKRKSDDDEKANKMASYISDQIKEIASSMEASLNDIAKSNEDNNAKSKYYSVMTAILKKSGEVANRLKQLPKINMTYETCKNAYETLKSISDNNSKMYNIVSRINTGIESGALDSKQKALTKFLNLYQKLRKCTEALLARFNGMSSSDSNTK